MSKISTINFKIHNAKQFKEAFSESSPTNMYLFIGRVFPWNDDNNPPNPNNSIENTSYDIWRSIIAMKKIKTSDTSFAISKNSWVSGTVYDQYRSNDPDLYNKTFYVVTDQNNVYKCLFNNNGSQSTVKPTGTSTSNFITSDGYKWKFMYSISSSESLKFVTSSYIPVQTLESDDSSSQWSVQQAASNGSIDIIEITNGGNNYIVNKGSFDNITNSSFLKVESTANSTDDVFVGSTLYISSGLGSGQIDEIVNYNGTTKELKLKNGYSITPNTSSTYHIGPGINIIGDGSGAQAYANTNSSGAISKVNIISEGQNYSRASVDVVANNGSGAILTPQLSPKGGHGSDAITELGGHSVMMNVRLDGGENGFLPTNNDFRTIGILKDPLTLNNGVANNDIYDTTTRFNITSVNGTFTKDEFVSGDSTNASGRVVRFANTNATGSEGKLYLTFRNDTAFVNSESITANSSGTTAVINGLEGESLKRRTGELMYLEYKQPVNRDKNQIEDFKIITTF